MQRCMRRRIKNYFIIIGSLPLLSPYHVRMYFFIYNLLTVLSG